MPPRAPRSAEVVADRLHAAASHLLRRLRRKDDTTGITAPRLSALSVIVSSGPLTLRELAAAEQVRPPTMTRLVDALEELGLVTREGDPRDKRRLRITATARGRALMARGRAKRVAALARRLSSLSPRELATLERATALLEQVTREL